MSGAEERERSGLINLLNDALKIREKIYNKLHKCEHIFAYISSEEVRYTRYYNSMYLIDDLFLGLKKHAERGFSSEEALRKLELLGILESCNVIQDAICQLSISLVGQKCSNIEADGWKKIRRRRVLIGAHSALSGDIGKNRDPVRAFIGRVSYKEVFYEYRKESDCWPRHEIFNLEIELEEFFKVLLSSLSEIFCAMDSISSS